MADSYLLRCIISPGQTDRLTSATSAFRTNSTSCALWCTQYQLHTIWMFWAFYWTDVHWDPTFRVSFDKAWLSLVSSEASWIMSDVAQCAAVFSTRIWTHLQCCSHHWKVRKTYFMLIISLTPSFSVLQLDKLRLQASGLSSFCYKMQY